ncbi:hypothetical protein THICB1_100334 [Thiomonas arsenitoxydans]|uniref:Uncharacterized protein n=1 Tax=Thiomonas arsenitoxydans (strain DSM 22701 / CIP 110005 / 3As) TaxID=426114 RepID=A0ABP1YY88_THIA3|nr:hypothetical protein THICB1_100334 [Thiomonas arsenitoxydans]CQR30373.1 hypothetical protein ACO3_230003 [Thiomonas arsenitoxydans]CQR30410.1 hypothetical protein ACO7_210003 [Thiomonas arsenitoxydans]CQR32212.1 hypothetical protein THICB6_160135 [Thiomonas arsenitoxydans]
MQAAHGLQIVLQTHAFAQTLQRLIQILNAPGIAFHAAFPEGFMGCGKYQSASVAARLVPDVMEGVSLTHITHLRPLRCRLLRETFPRNPTSWAVSSVG